MTPLLLDGRLRRLSQNAPHETVAFRRARTVVLFGAFVTARTRTGPRTELSRSGERSRVYSDFSNDLLRRIHSKTGHLSDAQYRVLMVLQLLGHQYIQSQDLTVQQLQTFYDLGRS